MASAIRDLHTSIHTNRYYSIYIRSKSLRCDMSLNKFLKLLLIQLFIVLLKQAISSFRHQDSLILCFLSKEQSKIFSLQPGEKTA
jgi:hypothetical protein